MLADQKVRFFDIKYDNERIDLNKDYLEKIKRIPQKNLKVELAHTLLDDAIISKFKRNIGKQKSFQERIQQSLNRYHAKFEDYETVMNKLEQVAKEVTQEINGKMNSNYQKTKLHSMILFQKVETSLNQINLLEKLPLA